MILLQLVTSFVSSPSGDEWTVKQNSEVQEGPHGRDHIGISRVKWVLSPFLLPKVSSESDILGFAYSSTPEFGEMVHVISEMESSLGNVYLLFWGGGQLWILPTCALGFLFLNSYLFLLIYGSYDSSSILLLLLFLFAFKSSGIITQFARNIET